MINHSFISWEVLFGFCGAGGKLRPADGVGSTERFGTPKVVVAVLESGCTFLATLSSRGSEVTPSSIDMSSISPISFGEK